ncbi:MAG: endopeptidase La [Blautia sp.]|nr:endopeptidase La [Blautia sp.]
MTVIPVYNMAVVPNASVFLQTDAYKKMAGKDPAEGERVIFMVMKEENSKVSLTDDSFYKIGVSGSVTEVNENGYVIVRTTGRISLNEIHIKSDHMFELTVTRRPDIADLEPDVEKEHMNHLKASLLKAMEGTRWEGIAKHYIMQFQSPEEVIAAASPWLSASNEERYAVLAEDSRKARMELIEKIIYEYLEISRLSSEAESAQENDYKKTYREAAIKKQIQYLQKELDDMHPENVSDIRKLEMRIEECGMKDEALREARKVLSRMKQDGSNSAEYGMLYDYLDFLTTLDWKQPEAQEISLTDAEQILNEDHYGLKKVKERIIQQIAVMSLNKKQSGSILLFVGAPGTGKTSIGQSIAKALGRKYVRVSLGGVRDEADIRGHRRTYIGAMAGRIMDGIHKSGVCNPVMVLDEVDKLSSSYNGDPGSALLEVLDPEQNHTFTDHYMNVPYDLSNVMFICTANTTDTIPEPLLNRMEMIAFPGYTATDKFQIARKHLLPRAMETMGIREDQLEVTDEAIREIISDYTRESGVRGLKKRMDTLCRVTAVRLVKGDVEKVTVDPDHVRDFLDMKPIRHEHILSDNKPGIVTGLAWTQAGGEILFIETLFTKGNGKIIITGQLGDVMKESAQIAVSLVKSMYPDKAELFEKNDLHIHVPDGAVPKDGPSAGIALTTAITSLVTDHPFNPEYAMTGEVSLRGVVKPIGGLPEKLMAAQRAGIKAVFIPEENEEDLKDVAEEVKERLEIIPVTNVKDVLGRASL